MANAVLVQGITATLAPVTGNAVLVQSVKAAATPPAAPSGNAVLVQSVKATAAAAPTANAGPDQTGVEPWATVTLTGAASVGATSYAWSQAAGPAVTVTGSGATRTFTATPSQAGSSFLFSLTVTDGSGVASAADTVAVTVLPTTEFTRVGGAWQPRRPRKRSGGAWA